MKNIFKLLSSKSRSKKGFSLVVTSLIVIAVSVTGTIFMINQGIAKQGKRNNDQNKHNEILNALKAYTTSSETMLCPADPTVPSNSTKYLKSAGTFPDCITSTANCSTASNNCETALDNKNGLYFKGLVPTRSLGLNDSYATDSNGYITYMVSKPKSSTPYYKINTDGKCITKGGTYDTGCNSSNSFNADSLDYKNTAPNIVLVSYGRNQAGAYSRSTGAKISAPVLSNNAKFMSQAEAINSDLVLTTGFTMDEFLCKPAKQPGNPDNISTSPSGQIYDDIVNYARVNVPRVACWGNSPGTNPDGWVGRFKQIAVNGSTTSTGAGCVIQSNDTLKCWNVDTSNMPTTAVKKVVVGNDGACAIMPDNTLNCWYGYYYAPSPAGPYYPLGLTKVKDITLGWRTACAILDDYDVKCWGDDLQNAISGSPGYPGAPAAGEKFIAISSTNYTYCGIKADNTVYCWGNSNGGMTNLPGGMPSAKAISVTSGAACIIKNDGSNDVYCWSSSNALSATNMPAGLKAKSLARHSVTNMCAIKFDDDSLVCWGDNSDGQTTVPADIKKVTDVDGYSGCCGNAFTCAIVVP